MDKLKIIIAINLLLLSGCKTTPKPYVEKSVNILKPETYSHIKGEPGDRGGMKETISFFRVDNIQLSKAFIAAPEEINVLPGLHKLWFEYTWFTSRAQNCIELDVKAGVNYIVKKKLEGYSILLWLETVDGKSVGNLC